MILDPAIVDAVTAMLIRNHRMCRPPRQAAKLLVYLVELYRQNKHFPPHAAVAAALDIPLPTLAAALSRYCGVYLSVRIGFVDGNVAGRASVTRRTYYVPTDDLLAAVAAAKRSQGQE